MRSLEGLTFSYHHHHHDGHDHDDHDHEYDDEYGDRVHVTKGPQERRDVCCESNFLCRLLAFRSDFHPSGFLKYGKLISFQFQ